LKIRGSWIVYYRYQGRGRLEAAEYRIKWDLVRDALLKRRTDDAALSRLVFPLRRGREFDELDDRALWISVAGALQPQLPG